MQNVTTEQAINNAAASSKMEGLIPTSRDLELIKSFVSGKITHEELLNIIKAECQRA